MFHVHIKVCGAASSGIKGPYEQSHINKPTISEQGKETARRDMKATVIIALAVLAVLMAEMFLVRVLVVVLYHATYSKYCTLKVLWDKSSGP